MSPITSLARQRKLMLDYAAEHGMTEAARTFRLFRACAVPNGSPRDSYAPRRRAGECR